MCFTYLQGKGLALTQEDFQSQCSHTTAKNVALFHWSAVFKIEGYDLDLTLPFQLKVYMHEQEAFIPFLEHMMHIITYMSHDCVQPFIPQKRNR